MHVDVVDRLQSLDPSILFVALQDIYPTRIAIVPIGENGLANKVDNAVSNDDLEFINVESTKF